MPEYPKACAEARKMAVSLKGRLLAQTSPHTEVATVVDTSFALQNGFITATTHKGPIQVAGAPYNQTCPGMQIFVRQMTHGGINNYVFDGFAPASNNFGTVSGAVMSSIGTGPAAANSLTYGSGTIAAGSPLTTIPASPPANGWFWSFFFYMASLPSAAAPCVLLDMPLINASWQVTGGFRITYNYLGQLNAYWYNWPPTAPATVVGTPSSQVFAPHHIWFVEMQLGNGIAVNGLQPAVGISNLTGTNSVVAGNYGMFLLSDSNGLNAAPAGSWISKVTFGCNYITSPLWPYNLSGYIPSQDSQIVQGTNVLGSGLTVYNRWLVSDSLSTTSIPGTGIAAMTLQVLGAIQTQGPY